MLSLLLDYITNHVSETVKELLFVFWQLSWPKENHTFVRVLATPGANGRFNKVFHYFPIGEPCDRYSGLTKKVLRK
jgi:hypothetical protein